MLDSLQRKLLLSVASKWKMRHDQDNYIISIVSANTNDSKDIWTWRNDEQTRLMSITTEKVSWETHSSWYDKSLTNPNRHLYVGILDGEKIGMCRFDIDTESKTAEVSINLNPQFRGKSLSSKLLNRSIEKFLKSNNLSLTSTIKKINQASIKCFIKSGFIFEREDAEYFYYIKNSI